MADPFVLAVFAGPSGGHLFPALAFGEAFRKKYPESKIFLVTGEKAKAFAAQLETGIFNEIKYFSDFPLPSGISLRSLRFLLELGRAFIFSSRFLSNIKPDLCVGFGSYVAYPGLVLAKRRKIPVVIHEQNLIPGKATSQLVRIADGVAVTFDETFRETPLPCRQKVGLPLRASLQGAALCEKKKGSREFFQILIVGGSQGARRLNEVVLESFSQFSSEEKGEIAVIHITGKADYERINQGYRRLGLRAEVYPFFDRIAELYQRADLAVTRAGANTLFELAAFKLPAIVVPYPYAGAHQKANADFFAVQGAVVVCEEAALDSQWLLNEIRSFQKDVNRRSQMAESLARLGVPDAAEKLVQLTEKFLLKEELWAPSLTT